MAGLQDFYQILSEAEGGEGTKIFFVKINKDHPIFSGHFPNHPVTPGVCTMQIGKELLEKTVGQKLIMTSASNIKFLTVINPEENPEISILLDILKSADGYKVKNTTSFGGNVAMKLSANYRPTEQK